MFLNGQMCCWFQPHYKRLFPHIRLLGNTYFSSSNKRSLALSFNMCERLKQHQIFQRSTLRSTAFHPTTQLPALACFREKQTKVEKPQELGDVHNKEYIELYFIKNISFLRVLCRFSRLSIVMFLFATPASLLSTQLGVLTPSTGTNIVMTFAMYAVLFTAQSWLFSSRVVGKIMISSDEEVVKVSHLSLFGDRRDVFLKPSDFVPSNKKEGIEGGFLKQNLHQVKIKSYPKVLIYMPHQGHLDTDHERIYLLLGGQYSKGR